MEKILFGIGMPKAEELLRKIINQNNPDYEIIDDVIIHKDREHIIEKIKNNNPTIVILRETLKGNDDIIQTIYLIKKHFDVRIIFIAKNRKPGDKLLATLVNYSIYDILMGTEIKVEEIAKLVNKKNTLRDVINLLPKPDDDDYDELLFEDTKKMEIDDVEEDEPDKRIRSPFGLIQKKEEVEEENEDLDIEDIFNRARPTTPKKTKSTKLFRRDIEDYKEELEEAEEPIKAEKTKRKKIRRVKEKQVKQESYNEVNSLKSDQYNEMIDNVKLDNQLKRLEEELVLEKDKLNNDLGKSDSEEKREEMKNLDQELREIRRLNRQREKEQKRKEKEELLIIERQKKLEEERELEELKKEREAEKFEREMRKRELDIEETYAKRSGVVINGSLLGTIKNKGKRFFIIISVFLIGSLLINLFIAYSEGKDLYTAFIDYSDFMIKLMNIILNYLKALSLYVVNLIKKILTAINDQQIK